MKWVAAYFPFTRPSLLLEIFFQNDWIELDASLRKLVLSDSAEKN
jgi:phenylalanyl-tRNA synthetase alpha subunit